jgi:hypothetical protein
MTKHGSLINFSLACPRALFTTWEDFHGNFFASPTTDPYLSETSIANDFLELDLTSNWSLNE